MTRTVLITGATSGIGRATAVRFGRAGWQVVAVGRRTERLAELRERLGERLATVVADVRDLEAVDDGISRLPAGFAQIDLLVNNAGQAYHEKFQLASMEEMLRVVDVNVRSMVGVTRLLLPMLIDRRGSIINVSSTAANYPHGHSVVYGGSKAFISHFSMALRSDLHGTGVRVTVVEPGRTTTEIVPASGYVQLAAEDVAEAMYTVAELPVHVNVNKIELMPVSQSLAGYQFCTAPRETDGEPEPAVREG